MHQVIVFISPGEDRFGGLLGKEYYKDLHFNPNENARVYAADIGSYGYLDSETGYLSKSRIILVPDAMKAFECDPQVEFKVLRHGNTPWEPVRNLIKHKECIGFAEGRHVADDQFYPKIVDFIWNCKDKDVQAADETFNILWTTIPKRDPNQEDVVMKFLDLCSSIDSAEQLIRSQGHVGDPGVKFLYDMTLCGQQVYQMVGAIVEDGRFNQSAYDVLARTLGDY